MPFHINRTPYSVPAPGVYPASVKVVEPEEHLTWGERAKFTFELTGHTQENGERTTVVRSHSLKFTPKAGLTSTVEALLGRKLSDAEAAEGLDLEDLEGIRCRLVLEHKVSETSGRSYANITSILPPEQAADDLQF